MPIVRLGLSKVRRDPLAAGGRLRRRAARCRTGRRHYSRGRQGRDRPASDPVNWFYLWARVRRHQADPRARPRVLLPALRRGVSRAGDHVPGVHPDAVRRRVQRVGLPEQVAPHLRRRRRHDRRAVRRRALRVRLGPRWRQVHTAGPALLQRDAGRERVHASSSTPTRCCATTATTSCPTGWRSPTSARRAASTPWG